MDKYEKYLRRMQWSLAGQESTLLTIPPGQLPFPGAPRAAEAIYMDEIRASTATQFWGRYELVSAGRGSVGQKKISKRTWPTIVVVKPNMPRAWMKEGDVRRPDYCRVQLLKHKTFSHAWLGHRDYPNAKNEIADYLAEHNGDWVEAYRTFALSPNAPRACRDDFRK